MSGLEETSDAFNIDTILGNLVSSVLANPDPDATASESITLHRYTELTAVICVYKEDEELWLQFRVGYLHGSAPIVGKMNFVSFSRKQQHNPFITMGGRQIKFADFFVNDFQDERHRFGADFVLIDLGVDNAADLLDYLLVRCDY